MEILRTPDERFDNLPGYDFAPHYTEVDGIRLHYVDEGPRDAPPVLLLHGEPSWSFLYRTMIPPLVAAGHRCVAPDLVGFGRSDKPTRRQDYTYQRHLDWLAGLVASLTLRDITLVCQDWGGLLGLRMIADTPELFARVVAANTFLPTGREPVGDAFHAWRAYSQETAVFDIGQIVNKGTTSDLGPDVIAAYNAPFPDDRYKEGARQFPVLVPIDPDTPDARANQAAWPALMAFDKPFLTAFSDNDPITRGADKLLQAAIRGCKGQPHTTIENAGHFLQEDAGEELASVINTFIDSTR
jgi:haloalkane dehalogenase